MNTAVKFLLLTFAFVFSSMEEFQDSNSERSESSSTIHPTITLESNLEKTENSQENNTRIERITSLMGKIKTCNEMNPKAYNSTIGDLLLNIWEYGKTPNISVLHPNISKEFVDWLKDKLYVDVLQDIIVLHSKDTPRGFLLFGKKRRFARDTILESDVFESITKVPEKSHIYLGLSLYPFLREESRIIDNYHTLPPPPHSTPVYEDGGVKRDPILKGPPGGIRFVEKKQPNPLTHTRVEND